MQKQVSTGGNIRLMVFILLGMGGVGGFDRAMAQGEKPAVVVNGEIITEQDFFERLQRLRGQDFLNANNQLRGESAGQIILNAMITERLTLQAAAKAKVALSDADTAAELANLKRQPQVVAGLTGHVFTEEMLKYDIRVQAARFKLATIGVKVSPEEVEKYYQAHLATYTIPERWGLSLIRTSNPDNLSKIDTDLKAGKSFADTARLYSEDATSKDKGGDLGVIAVNDTRLAPALRDAVRPLKVGAVTPAVKLEQEASDGKPKTVVWIRLLVTSKELETVRPFNDLKYGLQRLALIEKAGGYPAGDQRVAEFRSQSNIKINIPGYDNLAVGK